MSNDRDDLDWLYRREDDPEETRVFPDAERRRLAESQRATESQATPPAAPRPTSRTPRAEGAERTSRPVADSPAPRMPRSTTPKAADARRPVGTSRAAAPTSARRLGADEPALAVPKKRHPIRRTLLTLLVLWLAFMIGTPLFAWSRGTVVDAVPAGDRPAGQPGTAILLVGSDARSDLSAEDRSRLGTGSTDGARTDTMMILYTPRVGRSALISLPRDSYVSIPGHKKNKLNAAYSFGGPELLVETVEENTGIRLDGYLEIGLLGLVDTVDAVGGIEMCLDNPIQDKDSHLDLQAGCQTFDGVTALNYARMRKADAQGDLGRIKRQRQVIATVAKKATNPLHLLNPVEYWQLNMAVSNSIARSEETGLADMAFAAKGIVGTATGTALSLTVPIGNADAQTAAGSSVLWDDEASAEMFQAIQRGDTKALEKFKN